MTIPYMMNCPHTGEGWCLGCVSKMGKELATSQQELEKVTGQAGLLRIELETSQKRVGELKAAGVKESYAIRQTLGKALHFGDLDGEGIPEVIAEQAAKRIGELEGERDKLAKFKVYVHRRLDEAGVPVDPDSSHKAEGCRIGGRLDIVLAAHRQREEAEAACAVMRIMLEEYEQWGAIKGAAHSRIRKVIESGAGRVLAEHLKLLENVAEAGSVLRLTCECDLCHHYGNPTPCHNCRMRKALDAVKAEPPGPEKSLLPSSPVSSEQEGLKALGGAATPSPEPKPAE